MLAWTLIPSSLFFRRSLIFSRSSWQSLRAARHIWAAFGQQHRDPVEKSGEKRWPFVIAIAESSSPFAVGMAESRITTLKETKAWLEKKCGGSGCRVVRARITRIGFRQTATYLECPVCLKLIYSRDHCSHDINNPKSLYRWKAFLQHNTGELEATAWEVTRCFTGMSLDEFVASEMRDEEVEILERCIGRMWILKLSRAENQRGVYARIEYAEVVSKKVLFRGSSPCREATVTKSLPSSPVRTISAFGDGSSLVSTGSSTCNLESRGDCSKGAVDVTRKQFRRGFETGFVTCTMLVLGIMGEAVERRWLTCTTWDTNTIFIIPSQPAPLSFHKFLVRDSNPRRIELIVLRVFPYTATPSPWRARYILLNIISPS
ncbi:hypothetical protein R1sor_006635 [Riccia sorocarpa]|uniref:Uncharacterized protein n=1 Tax=Riccia sorocarpa TaxID=122646 RepID=A0ABD3HRL7_9MARC